MSATIKYYKALNNEPCRPRRKKAFSKDGKISDLKNIFLKNDITLEIFIKNLIENIFIAIDKPKVAKVTEGDDEDVFGDEGEYEFDESASDTDDL